MALIPPFFLDCVVAIGFTRQDGSIGYGATGFLHGDALPKEQGDAVSIYRLYLITNRHVLEGHKRVFLRFNTPVPHGTRVFEVELFTVPGAPIWAAHSDPDVDLAAFSVNADVLKANQIQFSFFLSDHHVLSSSGALDAGVSEGDGVYVLGFPLGLVSDDRNYVIARHGIIARIRDTLAGASKNFLIDAVIFPGNSGGPVVTRPEVAAIQGTKSVNAAWLLGIVSAYVPYRDVAVSQQTGQPRIIFEENSGLASIVPVDRMTELVNQIKESVKPQEPTTTAEPEQESN